MKPLWIRNPDAMRVFSRVLQIDEPYSGPAVCVVFGYLRY